METTRIELEGDFVLAYKDLMRKTARAVQTAYRKYMKAKPVPLAEIENLDYEVDISAVDPDEIAEIIILNQVTEWSFGPVTKDTLDKMPNQKYLRLQKELDVLYKPVPLAAEGQNPASSPLSTASLYR
jgi:hypothetical protein